MNAKSKILMAIASLSLIIVFFVPIWSITLEAPQYPEGLGLNIHVSSIEGHKKNDLNSINNLNHYIGMKKITPNEIPELKIMPYIILFFIITGLVFAFIGKKPLILIWIILFLIIGIIGMYDFYMWEYDYGHHLDPKAIIKIPGQYYQPPLFGTEQLLNFTAHSYPGIGGYVILFSNLIAIIILFLKKKNI